jgi:hypothetical protein
LVSRDDAGYYISRDVLGELSHLTFDISNEDGGREELYQHQEPEKEEEQGEHDGNGGGDDDSHNDNNDQD